MDLTKHLNKEQLEAGSHVEGPMLVIAGAGSGKTRVVTYRVAHLLDIGVPASDILAVTFTNKAAGEMRERIQNLSNTSILTSTFHSLCARILRESIEPLGFNTRFAIFDEDDSEKVLKQCLADQKGDKGLLKKIRSGISTAKNGLLTPEVVMQEDPVLGAVFAEYQGRLKTYNALDFDDLLYQTVLLFKQEAEVLARYQETWNFILIDEYQDTNEAQYILVKLLAEKHHNVFAVGDPDQSIYSWRGANIQNILNFEKDFPGAKVVALEQNYRSKEIILQAAAGLIEHNEHRYERKLWSERGEGEKIGLYICDSEREEVAFVIDRLLQHHENENVPLSESVIFYRTHFQSRAFEDALLRERIPYIIVGGISFYLRREVKDIIAFLRLAIEGADFLSFSRTVNLPKRGIGDATLSKLRLLAAEGHGDLILAIQAILDGKLPLKLSAKQQAGLASYLESILAIRKLIRQDLPIDEILSETLKVTGYLNYLKSDPDTFEDRQENLEELISKGAQWQEECETPTLSTFLEEIALKSSQETQQSGDALRLMTLHNGKGLEFTSCFMVGMEEDLFPHANSRESAEALEEERRLCYVGMTRAKDHLYLSAAKMRYLWGNLRPMRPSRFLFEIPETYLQPFHAPPATEYSFPESSEGFNPGDRVVHKDFGPGIIQKSYQTSLGLTYDVQFQESSSERSLIAKYAKLAKG